MRKGKEFKMNKFIVRTFIFLFVATLWQAGFFEPLVSQFGGTTVSVSDASHRGGGDNGRGRGGGGGGGGDSCRGRRCPPPTVSELPIQYMVLSGAALILLSASTVLYIRKQRVQNSPEA